MLSKYIFTIYFNNCINKGNNKITELRTILQNCENRNAPDLVQVVLKKWWVESADIYTVYTDNSTYM